MFKPHKIRELINKAKTEDKKFTLGNFCDEIQLSSPGLNNILDGNSVPKVTTLELIADYFGVDMNYFFDYQSKEIEKKETLRITDGNEYILRRFEEVVAENAIMKKKLEEIDKIQGTSYSLQNVPNTIAAEPETKLNK